MYVVGIYVRKKKKQFMGEAVDAALEDSYIHIFSLLFLSMGRFEGESVKNMEWSGTQ